MNEEKFEEFKEDFALLIEAGFVAAKQMDEISATRIFYAAQCLSPKNTAPKIGLGFIALNKLELKEATRIFESVVEVEPDNHLAQTFLGICLLLTKGKRKKGEKHIHDTMQKTTDPTIKNLGASPSNGPKKTSPKKAKPPSSPLSLNPPQGRRKYKS